MAGIYLHIPFCKQKCSYCNFHFSTDLKLKDQMVQALLNEIKLRAMDTRETLQTIYLGGGTPSLLDLDELNALFETIYKHYSVADQPEITLEANPDDLSFEKLTAFKSTPINRLSIGVQS